MIERTVKIHSVAEGELPKDGERVVALSTCFGHMDVYLLTLPHVFWNKKKKRFTTRHGHELNGFSIDFWFYEIDLTGVVEAAA